MPVLFVVNPGDPLIGKASLSFADIASYPTLGLPTGLYAKVKESLKAIGWGSDHVRMMRYQRDPWEGKTEAELAIGYASALSLEISAGSLVKLPLKFPFRSGKALVVRREFTAHPEGACVVGCASVALETLCRSLCGHQAFCR